MLTGILYLFFSLTAFLIISEIITINLFYQNSETLVEFNFTIFAVALNFSKDKKRHQRQKLKRFRLSPYALKKIAFYFIKKSEIIIYDLVSSLPSEDPATDSLRYGIYNLFLSSLLVFAKENSKKFSADNIILGYSDHNKTELIFKAQFKISLVNILICSIIFVFYSIRSAVSKKARKLWQKIK